MAHSQVNIEKKQNHLSSNIEFLLRSQSLDIKNLSILTGVPAPSISRLKREGANPTIATLEPIANYFDIDIETLLYTNVSNSNYNSTRESVSEIPIYHLDDVCRNDKIAIDYMGVHGVKGEHSAYGVRVPSESLKPVFNKGSLLIVDSSIKPQEGDYVLCSTGEDESPVFRQVFLDGRRMFFKPINPLFGESSTEAKYNVLGVIVKSVEQFR